ncbi:efflux RND transporter permease subunit [Joostella atrarenae]|uniref:Efflux RND transporter permease subunit n=1 Tax=Joostella atrarenae TaxID=679257 RepID=A0ABS9J7D2_9FLAO|nr:efflux RND transporter permease subunit [Joostella atrarenae]MCF8716342.1 efflux RND transporter permease subunit [Joostella atrarenae]
MLKFLIYRPIAVLITTLALTILGIVTIHYIPISLMPSIEVPEITVQVEVENLSNKEMEEVVSKPLRRALMQVNHLKDIKSQTFSGKSVIKLFFDYGTNLDYSFILVNEKVDIAMKDLPRNTERPKVLKSSTSEVPVYYLTFTLKNDIAIDDNGNITQEFLDFNLFVDQVIKRRIEQIPEVAMVDLNGLVSPVIAIKPYRNRLLSLGIGIEEIETAIRSQMNNLGTIQVKDQQYQYNLHLETGLQNIKDIQTIYIKKDNRLFQLSELAEISYKPENRNGLSLFNDKEAITMAVIKQGDSQMNEFKQELSYLIEYLKKDYPTIDISIIRDQAKLLDYAINSLFQSLLLGVFLSFCIMFLFMNNFKSPFLIGLSIPVSIAISVLLFNGIGISINIISLSGLIIGSGLMVDNSIIVIDNIHQYRERGSDITTACIEGTEEVIRPLLSSVLTTCTIFIPLIFIHGLAGEIFYEQAIAISVCLFVSFFVSIIVIPVLYRQFYINYSQTFKPKVKKRKFNYSLIYERFFLISLRKPHHVFLIFIGLLLIGTLSFFVISKERIPKLTSSEIALSIDWNEPITVDENRRRIVGLMKDVKSNLKNYNAQIGREQFLLQRGSNSVVSEANVYLEANSNQHLDELKLKIQEKIKQQFPRAIFKIKNVENIFNLLFENETYPLSAHISSFGDVMGTDFKMLQKLKEELENKLKTVSVQPVSWESQIVLLLDRKKMMMYGISYESIINSLKVSFNEKNVASLVTGQNVIPIIMGSNKNRISSVIKNTKISDEQENYYNLELFVSPVVTKNLSVLTAGKEGLYYPVNINEGKDEQKVMAQIKEVVSMFPEYQVTFTGDFFKNRALQYQLAFIFFITILLLYFILASQFESLTLPLIILMEIPVTIAGIFLFLFIFNISLNLMSMIGIIVTSGIIINDSILKIDTIIHLRKGGCKLIRAVLIAGKRRLKPILMTSLTTILTISPVLFLGGMGNELQAPLAISLIGGMIIGTLVSLYFVPLSYYYLAKTKEKDYV